MGYVQISEYSEQRRSMWIVNQGPDPMLMSLNLSDLAQPTPVGITLSVNTPYRMSYALDGELVWQRWYGQCTVNTLAVYQWILTPGSEIEPVSRIITSWDDLISVPRKCDRCGQCECRCRRLEMHAMVRAIRRTIVRSNDHAVRPHYWG